MVSITSGKFKFAAILFSVVVLFYIHSASAFSIREFLGLDKPEPEKKADTTETAPAAKAAEPGRQAEQAAGSDFVYKLDFEELEKVVSVLNPEQRKVILSDEEAFRNFINNEARNKSILAAAHANRIDQNERNLFIAKRGAENVIREIYMNQLIASRIPEGFPTEEQMLEFYENNKENFTLPERVPVWQIFLPIEEGADQKEIELLKKQAETIITDINKGKLDFAAAARQYSAQQAGKLRGGYLGLVRVTELRPEIQEPLMALAPDKLSSPITAENGIHILKRGNAIEKQQLAYEDVKGRIRETMTNQLRNRIRQAVFQQASEVYPSGITDKDLEEWRLKLRTSGNTDSSAASAN